MQCLKSLSNRKKNLLTFVIGFVVGVAGFWGLFWWIYNAPGNNEGAGYGLLSISILPFLPLIYIAAWLNIDVTNVINGLWFGSITWGVIIGLLFLLVKWFFVKLKR